MTNVERKLRAALKECIETLRLSVEPLPQEDPQYGEAVRELGNRIGYGAMMSSASAAWRKRLHEMHYPVGGEHTSGACVVTIQRVLKIARSALAFAPKKASTTTNRRAK